ncbi:MAG: thioredoxin-related protein [Akkermansiaceae bacterium]|jgi:thioredoxin-related protein
MKTMKASIFALLAAFTVSAAHAGDYLTDFEAAKKKAVADKKPLLVKFTGSDWCPPCIKLQKEVFSKSSFKKAVEKDFVVVVLDYPRKKKLPKDQTAANKKVAKKYGLKSYPTVMLMDSKGKVFKSMSGYNGAGAKAYLKSVQDSLKAKKFQ